MIGTRSRFAGLTTSVKKETFSMSTSRSRPARMAPISTKTKGLHSIVWVRGKQSGDCERWTVSGVASDGAGENALTAGSRRASCP